jgi:deoxyribodipyrimidine photolyase-related protein
MATKPYISSGSYIHKMGDHCDHCEYDVNLKTGEKACPFNILYWDYIDRNQDKLASNMRMQIPLSMLKKMDKKKLSAFKKEALILLKNIEKL